MNIRILLALVIVSTGCVRASAQGCADVSEAMQSSTADTNAWGHSPWFGWYWNSDGAWIYHPEGGWTYFAGCDGGGGMYLYDANSNDWIWTSSSAYPWTYSFGSGEWLVHPREAVVAPAGMVHVVGGTFYMDERPTTVSSFHMAIYPTTLDQWVDVRAWAVNNGYDLSGVGSACAGNHPVSYVNWYDAFKWCNARSEMEGLTPVYYTDTNHTQIYRTGQVDLSPAHVDWEANGYRLPTEAEHWFAHSGGLHSQGYLYAGSNDPIEAGWHFENSSGAPCNIQDGRGSWPVGMKAPNELGLYDMSGNVWEATFDWYQEDIGTDPVINPRGPETGDLRTGRGGSWLNEAQAMETGLRGWAPPAPRNALNGFRVARTPDR